MGEERRGSPRVPLGIPLRVRWTSSDGNTTEEQILTEVLNGAGARFRLKHPVKLGLEMEVVNLENQESARARVVWAGDPTPQSEQYLAIEFLTPRAAFWGSRYLL